MVCISVNHLFIPQNTSDPPSSEDTTQASPLSKSPKLATLARGGKLVSPRPEITRPPRRQMNVFTTLSTVDSVQSDELASANSDVIQGETTNEQTGSQQKDQTEPSNEESVSCEENQGMDLLNDTNQEITEEEELVPEVTVEDVIEKLPKTPTFTISSDPTPGSWVSAQQSGGSPTSPKSLISSSPPVLPLASSAEPRHKIIDTSILGSTSGNDWMADMESVLNFGGEEKLILEAQKIPERNARYAAPAKEVPKHDWTPSLKLGETLLNPEFYSVSLKCGKKGEKLKVNFVRFTSFRLLLLLVCFCLKTAN